MKNNSDIDDTNDHCMIYLFIFNIVPYRLFSKQLDTSRIKIRTQIEHLDNWSKHLNYFNKIYRFSDMIELLK